jgi:hypothetical protein
MPKQDQLEIITPDGVIEFYTLDRSKGIINIGRHPDNDVVVDSPSVTPFHVLVDYSRKPYHVTLLSQEGETTLGGQKLSPNVPTEFNNWDVIEVGGYAVILLEGMDSGPVLVGQDMGPVLVGQDKGPVPGRQAMGPAVGLAPVPVERPLAPPLSAAEAPADAGLAVVPAPETAMAPVSQVFAPATTPYPDISDDVVITELSEREWTVNVEQAAICQVTITNGGSIVASFVVRVEGVPENWVTVSPPQINLNEGERGSVTIAITAPRLSSSRAGTYHLAIVVTSPNHPGRSSQRNASLEVNPYYEFAVGELSPRQQTIGGRRPAGRTVLHVANKGNSEVPARLEAMDDERACSFEFKVPGESTSLARQAEMRLPPEETFAIPIHITPASRPLVGLRSRSHSFTVTAMLLEGQLTPRSLLGQVKVRPLIGPLLLALLAIALFTLTILIFRPRIYNFEANLADDILSDGIVNPGETVRLTWRASPFTSLSIEEDWFESGVKTRLFLDRDERQKDVTLAQDVRYTLIAENFLSNALGFIRPARWTPPVTIDVFPLQPRIIGFNLDSEEIVTGQDVTLRWRTENADEVALSYRTEGNTGEIIIDPVEYSSGIRTEAPQVPTTYILCAKNDYGEDRPCEERTVAVREPTPTPLPVPLIQSFSVLPREIYAGENVTITWHVENATSVRISRSDGFMEEKKDLTGDTIQTLAQLGVMKYSLLAIFDDGQGHPDGPSTREGDEEIVVVVEKPTPTPEPQKPVIVDFRVVPDEVVRGDNETIQLVWSIDGTTTNVEISGPTLSTVGNLDSTGSLHVTADATTFFVLTAYNGDLTASKTAELTVEEPTPTPEPPPTPTPEPPPPVIDFFTVRGADDPGDVTLLGSGTTANSLRYEVVAGAKVIFSWSVQNATEVFLVLANGDQTAQPTAGDSNPMVVTQGGTYQLLARNIAGVERGFFIQITTREPQPPPSPEDISGPAGQTTPLIITWSYDPNFLYRIIGFRIYRASAPFTAFDRKADEAELDEMAREWEDPNPICGQAYYVVAVYEVYENGEKVPRETAPSVNRYYSWPCPTPTP